MVSHRNKQLFLVCCHFIATTLVGVNAEETKAFKQHQNVFVTLKSVVDQVIQEFQMQSFPSRGARITAFSNALKNASRESQAKTLKICDKFNTSSESFWISNQIYVRNASRSLITALKQHPDVIKVEREFVISNPWASENFSSEAKTERSDVTWGVRKIGADNVWRLGTYGQGIRVAVIDTGARWTHKALRDNYVGAANYGWYDPIYQTKTPTDDGGHGTHCAGVICGRNGIGVAPSAKWMACHGCHKDDCPAYALLSCGQWALCPTNTEGKNSDCSKAPHVISNSWSGTGGRPWYNDVIKAWTAAGIVPIFSIGNGGPACKTAHSPADQLAVISVGSVGGNDRISNFSGRGPIKAANGNVAPLLVAPGEHIWSAFHDHDESYVTWQGASMSTPYVAGAAALLLSKNKEMSYNNLRYFLFSTANQELWGVTDSPCGNGNEYPNNVAGYGRVDVYKAFLRLTGRV